MGDLRNTYFQDSSLLFNVIKFVAFIGPINKLDILAVAFKLSI